MVSDTSHPPTHPPPQSQKPDWCSSSSVHSGSKILGIKRESILYYVYVCILCLDNLVVHELAVCSDCSSCRQLMPTTTQTDSKKAVLIHVHFSHWVRLSNFENWRNWNTKINQQRNCCSVILFFILFPLMGQGGQPCFSSPLNCQKNNNHQNPVNYDQCSSPNSTNVRWACGRETGNIRFPLWRAVMK